MRLNTQETEKPECKDTVEMHSIFYTLQGEGPFSGHPAIFVRMAGCNLQCKLCDTEYTKGRLTFTHDELVKRILLELEPHKEKTNLIVFTGGEPMRQNIGPVIDQLIDKELMVQIETNGTLWWVDNPNPENHEDYDHKRGRWSHIVCSPKTASINPKIRPFIKSWKYILEDGYISPIDGLPTSSLGEQCYPARPWERSEYQPPFKLEQTVFIQPVDVGDVVANTANIAAATASALKFGWRLSLQIHKTVGVP